MGWWFGYAAARALGDVIRGEVARPTRHAGEDYLLPDEKARQQLCARIAEDPELEGSRVAVSVLSGALVLTGSVTSEQLGERIVALARATPGVQSVRSELTTNAAT